MVAPSANDSTQDEQARIARAMARGLTQVAQQYQVSSCHVTFPDSMQAETLRTCGFLQRTGLQYHWNNNGYDSFDDFLAQLKPNRRKSIRQVA